MSGTQNPAPTVPEPANEAGQNGKKLALTLHRNGQWCKKIKGKLYYFGTDYREAVRKMKLEFSDLYSGKGRPQLKTDGLNAKDLAGMYMDYQADQLRAHKIKYARLYDCQRYLAIWLDYIGDDTQASEIRTIDIHKYRTWLVDKYPAVNTANPRLAVVKAMFRWAARYEVMESIPNVDAVEQLTREEVSRHTYSQDELGRLLSHAGPQMKAMIMLGINCSFGPTDVAMLTWNKINFEKGEVHHPRIKTKVKRGIALWPATLAALQQVPRRPDLGPLVFYTKYGNPWVLQDGQDEHPDRALSKAFAKLMRKAKVKGPPGTGFYTLRRTAATIGGETGNTYGVQGLLGHTTPQTSSIYIQDVSPQTREVTDHVYEWFQGVTVSETTSPQDSE